MKLKTKIHIFSTILMLIILTLTTIGIYFLYEKMAYDTEYQQLLDESQELVTSISQTSMINDPATILRAYIPSNGAIRIVDDHGKSLVAVQSMEGIEDYKPKLQEDHYLVETYKGKTILSFKIPVIWMDGSVVYVQMMQSMESVASTLSLLKLVLSGMAVLAAILVLLSSMTLAEIVLRPIQRLTATMKRSSKSGTFEKIDVTKQGKDELGEMSQTFNDMMSQLEQNYRKQEQFVSNASHELKTPLTVIESYARLLKRRGFDNREVAVESVEAILSESIRMSEMIQQMLELAKNKERAPLQMNRLDVHTLLNQTLQQMHQAYNRNFYLHGKGPVFITTDEQKIKQLFFIFLENARRYSEDDIHVYISNHPLVVKIKDQGDGIAEEHIPYLFERFYRVSQDRNRKTGGTGLGLAIATEIAAQLHISLSVKSTVGIGTTMILTFNEQEEGQHEKI
ncbi:HAMP domain-containing histidine kinase [Rummeliibacillus pycnus]|uniref:HAMP domain-containing histidine kinase n=1 Tax=Rummeliibacillus pycnus TaxID=101070 RepID=UPI000C9CDDB5|nr:HAMP domain-containing histidine kinase [Rummeliibacillus pycnus]